jgi:hypothetical protein
MIAFLASSSLSKDKHKKQLKFITNLCTLFFLIPIFLHDRAQEPMAQRGKTLDN